MGLRVAAAAALLAAVLGGGLFFRGEVRAHCRQVEGLILQGTEDPAALERATDLWEAGLPTLSSLLNHEPLEEVGLALARAKGALQAGDSALAESLLAAALYLLDDIREYDDISWKNLI